MKRGIAFVLTALLLLLLPGTTEAKLMHGVFIDTRGHWAESEIDTAYNSGLMQGTGINQSGFKVFSPEESVTRFQLAAVMQRAFDLDFGKIQFIEEPAISDFYYDVEDERWYTQPVILGAINHIFIQIDEFKGSEEVSRIELATAIYRAFQAQDISVPMIMLMPQYDDTADLTQEEINAMVFVSNTGIMKGYDQLFRPHDPVKRSELARVLNQCTKLIENNPAEILPISTIKLASRSVKNNLELINIDLQIPVVSGLQNEEVQNKLNQLLENEALERQNSMIAEAQSMSQYIQTEPYHTFEMVSRFYKFGADQDVLSFYVDYYYFTGGAHGMTERKAYNFDINTGEELSLSDLFDSNYDYKTMINDNIQEAMNRSPGMYFTGSYGFQGISEEQGFYLENNSLIIFFQQYEVAPYAAGIREFAVPYQ
ncbi:hypothetical protein ASZ90_019923 [hydrocarbon metagenome]|uniref:SLH domain-containing protein n=1 Tax=hydrocarbon metagenome TaxID=938273 RepID=A0A0W8E240_9ZZZZ